MPEKPSEKEDEYFVRQDMERRRKLSQEREAKIAEEERERARVLHFMKCPKCGTQLEEITFNEVRIDKCFNCEGFWLDKGEIDAIQHKEAGFLERLRKAF
jgi:uncharacterized protein